MKITKGYKFFLKVAFVCLVVSVFLPFAFESLSVYVSYLYRGDYDGPLLNTSYRTWAYYWSFMYVSGNASTPTLLPESILICVRVGFLPNYWNWGTPLPRLIFPLQIALITLGFLTMKKAKRALSIIPFFLGMLVLSALCFSTATIDFSTPSFGFWILVVATLLIFIALTLAERDSILMKEDSILAEQVNS